MTDDRRIFEEAGLGQGRIAASGTLDTPEFDGPGRRTTTITLPLRGQDFKVHADIEFAPDTVTNLPYPEFSEGLTERVAETTASLSPTERDVTLAVTVERFVAGHQPSRRVRWLIVY